MSESPQPDANGATGHMEIRSEDEKAEIVSTDPAAQATLPEAVDVVDMSHVSSLLAPCVKQYLLQCLDATMSSLHGGEHAGSPSFHFKLGTDCTLPWTDADQSVNTGALLVETSKNDPDLIVSRDTATREWCIDVNGSDTTYALLGDGNSKLDQVLIVGEPGIGKTALLTQLAHGITNAALREPEKALSLPLQLDLEVVQETGMRSIDEYITHMFDGEQRQMLLGCWKACAQHPAEESPGNSNATERGLHVLVDEPGEADGWLRECSAELLTSLSSSSCRLTIVSPPALCPALLHAMQQATTPRPCCLSIHPLSSLHQQRVLTAAVAEFSPPAASRTALDLIAAQLFSALSTSDETLMDLAANPRFLRLLCLHIVKESVPPSHLLHTDPLLQLLEFLYSHLPPLRPGHAALLLSLPGHLSSPPAADCASPAPTPPASQSATPLRSGSEPSSSSMVWWSPAGGSPGGISGVGAGAGLAGLGLGGALWSAGSEGLHDEIGRRRRVAEEVAMLSARYEWEEVNRRIVVEVVAKVLGPSRRQRSGEEEEREAMALVRGVLVGVGNGFNVVFALPALRGLLFSSGLRRAARHALASRWPWQQEREAWEGVWPVYWFYRHSMTNALALTLARLDPRVEWVSLFSFVMTSQEKHAGAAPHILLKLLRTLTASRTFLHSSPPLPPLDPSLAEIQPADSAPMRWGSDAEGGEGGGVTVEELGGVIEAMFLLGRQQCKLSRIAADIVHPSPVVRRALLDDASEMGWHLPAVANTLLQHLRAHAFQSMVSRGLPEGPDGDALFRAAGVAALGDLATRLALQLSAPHPAAARHVPGVAVVPTVAERKGGHEGTPSRPVHGFPFAENPGPVLVHSDPAAAVLAGVGEKLAGVKLEQSPPPSPASALDELESLARFVLKAVEGAGTHAWVRRAGMEAVGQLVQSKRLGFVCRGIQEQLLVTLATCSDPDAKVQEIAREALRTAAVQEALTEWSRERGRGEGGEGASHKCRVAVEVLCREGTALWSGADAGAPASKLCLSPFIFFFLSSPRKMDRIVAAQAVQRHPNHEPGLLQAVAEAMLAEQHTTVRDQLAAALRALISTAPAPKETTALLARHALPPPVVNPADDWEWYGDSDGGEVRWELAGKVMEVLAVARALSPLVDGRALSPLALERMKASLAIDRLRLQAMQAIVQYFGRGGRAGSNEEEHEEFVADVVREVQREMEAASAGVDGAVTAGVEDGEMERWRQVEALAEATSEWWAGVEEGVGRGRAGVAEAKNAAAEAMVECLKASHRVREAGVGGRKALQEEMTMRALRGLVSMRRTGAELLREAKKVLGRKEASKECLLTAVTAVAACASAWKRPVKEEEEDDDDDDDDDDDEEAAGNGSGNQNGSETGAVASGNGLEMLRSGGSDTEEEVAAGEGEQQEMRSLLDIIREELQRAEAVEGSSAGMEGGRCLLQLVNWGWPEPVRLRAASVLPDVNPRLRPQACQALLEVLADASKAMRGGAWEALVKLGVGGQAVMRVIGEMMARSETEGRLQAAQTIAEGLRATEVKEGELEGGRGREGLLKALSTLLEDSEGAVREAALLAAKEGGAQREVLDIVAKMVGDAEAAVRLQAALTLANEGMAGEEVETVLLGVLVTGPDDGNPVAVRVAAADALRIARFCSQQAVMVLVSSLLSDPSAQVRDACREALQKGLLLRSDVEALQSAALLDNTAAALFVVGPLVEYLERRGREIGRGRGGWEAGRRLVGELMQSCRGQGELEASLALRAVLTPGIDGGRGLVQGMGVRGDEEEGPGVGAEVTCGERQSPRSNAVRLPTQ